MYKRENEATTPCVSAVGTFGLALIGVRLNGGKLLMPFDITSLPEAPTSKNEKDNNPFRSEAVLSRVTIPKSLKNDSLSAKKALAHKPDTFPKRKVAVGIGLGSYPKTQLCNSLVPADDDLSFGLGSDTISSCPK